MQDIFYRCMLTSDPVILAFFEEELLKKRPEKRPITEGIRNLMADPKDIPHYMDIDDEVKKFMKPFVCTLSILALPL